MQLYVVKTVIKFYLMGSRSRVSAHEIRNESEKKGRYIR